MKVWIDQDLCTGDGLCEEIAPAVFTLLDDGLAYVKEGADVRNEPGGSSGMAAVPGDLEDAVVEASEECPGEGIFPGQGGPRRPTRPGRPGRSAAPGTLGRAPVLVEGEQEPAGGEESRVPDHP